MNTLMAGRKLVVSVFACLAVLFLGVSIAQAQTQTATLSGTASDSSGGVLAGAKVEAKNVATNSVQSTVTDASGRYTIPALLIGSYDVQASASGFQTVVHKGITLTVGANLVLEFSLPVGSITQTVSVESQVSQVETTTAAISSLVSSQQVSDLPLNGRNYTQLVQLAPGVQVVPNHTTAGLGGQGGFYGAQTNISVGGSRPEGQAYLIDNEDVRDFWEHGPGAAALGTALGVEGIAEFQVLTNTYGSQFSGNGVVINSATKSGTNTLHGSAYEFLRNSALDAKNFFDFTPVNNANGGCAPGPCGTAGSAPVVAYNKIPEFRQNQFGGSAGGPIIKDKLFFFANYEGFRNSQGITYIDTVPEPYVANGYLPSSRVAGPTCGPAPVGTPPPPTTGGPYTYVGFGCGSPQAADAAATVKGILGLFALAGPPTGADSGGYGTLSTSGSNVQSENYVIGRVDYNISSKDSLFGRYISDRAHQLLPFSGSPVLPLWPETDIDNNQYFTLQERRIVSPTVVNSIRGIYTRTYANAATGNLPNPTGVACSAAACPDPLQFVAQEPFPQNKFTDGNTSAGCSGCSLVGSNGFIPYYIAQSRYGGGDDIVWTHGAHSFKAGVAITRVLTNIYAPFELGGSFLWFTEQSFMEGAPFLNLSTFPGHGNSDRNFKEIDYAPYFEDDWKVSSKLTLNLGARYDFGTNPTGGPFAVIINSPLPDQTPYFKNALTGAGPAFANGFTPVKHVFQASPNALNFEPRIGIAFDPFSDHKTAIRAGFGMFNDSVAPRTYASQFYFSPPYAAAVGQTIPIFPNPFAGLVPGGPTPEAGEVAGVNYLTNRAPYVMQYNLTIQRQIASGTVLSVGYVGSEGRHLFSPTHQNPPMCNTPGTAPGSAPTNAPAICGSLTTLPNFWNGTFGLAGPVANPRVNTTVDPYVAGGLPYFGDLITEDAVNTSNYNSLQASLNRQFSRGLQGQVSYTYSKCMTTGSGTSGLEQANAAQDDPYNRHYDYGLCSYDIRNNLTLNFLYALPFKGNRLVEGWQITSILAVTSGLPINVVEGGNADTALIGIISADRPDYGNPKGTCPGGKGQVLGKWYEWFNETCYAPPGASAVLPFGVPGQLGNVPKFSLEGPNLRNLDTSIIKNTKISERLNTQFRAEFFNVLNHTNLGLPNPNVYANPGQLAYQAGDVGGVNNAGAIALTSTSSRQIQFALKLIF
ncbi:MAG TPA: carboxypeptidase-like regulatory domain-containing protein [Candidatus Acidoferrales bacterium]|nr:carboxypeptidase-like regulatory domain-containing protein [Candidatus Acidoferrales bacterium]